MSWAWWRVGCTSCSLFPFLFYLARLSMLCSSFALF